MRQLIALVLIASSPNLEIYCSARSNFQVDLVTLVRDLRVSLVVSLWVLCFAPRLRLPVVVEKAFSLLRLRDALRNIAEGENRRETLSLRLLCCEVARKGSVWYEEVEYCEYRFVCRVSGSNISRSLSSSKA